MSKTTTAAPAIQHIVNLASIKLAEAQYRLARLFTPFGFEPEKVDFDRVKAFTADVDRAFPEPSDALRQSLDRIKAQIAEQQAVLEAFASQNVAPTLDEEQLFQTAQANVRSPGSARYAA